MGKNLRISTGYVLINADYARTAPAGFGADQPHGNVLMHELGHLVGLDHPEEVPRLADDWQVMTQSGGLPASVWGAGDLAGLRRVGRTAGCLR